MLINQVINRTVSNHGTEDLLTACPWHIDTDPGEFRAGLRATQRQSFTGGRVFRAFIQLFRGIYFFLRQAVFAVTFFAQSNLRIKVTLERLCNNAVFEAVQFVASRYCCVIQYRHICCVQDGVSVGAGIRACLPAVEEAVLHRKVHCRRTGDDAVKVTGITLCFNQRFATTV